MGDCEYDWGVIPNAKTLSHEQLTTLPAVLPELMATTPFGWVVAKPAHWLSVAGRESPEKRSKPQGVVRQWLEHTLGHPVFVVHRLDLETSGVMLFAKDAQSHRELNHAFEKHTVKKEYWALCAGQLRQPTMRVDLPIEGRKSLTQFESVAVSGAEYCRVRARPLTGRRHQIRIHLQSIGCPIWGDTTYGGPRTVGGTEIARVALHAARIELPTGEAYECAPPADWAAWASLPLWSPPLDEHKR